MMSFYNNPEVRGPNFVELKIYTNNPELKEKILTKAKEINESFHNTQYPDAGFDLYTPIQYFISPGETKKIDLQVKCAMFLHNYKYDPQPISYYLYPRSSTGTKTKLRLANSVGIIDSGYRGNIIAAFDNIGTYNEVVTQWSRIVQICSPTLEPFMVTVSDTPEELGETSRNIGGFGSTGE